MPRPATGSVVPRITQGGRVTFLLRFTVEGKRRSVNLGEVTREEADRELRHILADVERGEWQPPQLAAPAARELPTFHAFCEEWWTLHVEHLAPKTITDYRWRLERHLLPYFAQMALDQIDIPEVDKYRATKLRDGDLSGSSINKTITTLSAIFEAAVEARWIEHNPARGRKRKVRVARKAQTHLNRAEEIEVLLEAADQLDREASARDSHVQRRAILATLLFSGLRIGELCDLRWRDVDLAGGWLQVRRSKTDAGVRRIKIRGALRDDLTNAKARAVHADPNSPVFATRDGGVPTVHNLRARVINKATGRAAKLMEARGQVFPEGITPHSLRRTFASILFALGEPHPVVMVEMGHTNVQMTLGIYAQAVRLDDDEKERLVEMVHGVSAHETAHGLISDAQAA